MWFKIGGVLLILFGILFKTITLAFGIGGLLPTFVGFGSIVVGIYLIFRKKSK